MNKVIDICQPNKIWSLEEANEILPLLKYISRNCDTRVNTLLGKQKQLIRCQAAKEKIDEIDTLVIKELNRWGTKFVKLGAKPFQGQVLFNKSDGGCWSWYTNEPSIEYYYNIEDPMHMRRRIQP